MNTADSFPELLTAWLPRSAGSRCGAPFDLHRVGGIRLAGHRREARLEAASCRW